MIGPRFHLAEPIGPARCGDIVALPEGVAHHAARVLRLAAGDVVVLFDGRGGEYAATLVHVDKREVTARLDRHDAVEREAPVAVTLAQAVLATDAMDYAVRKAVELGVARVVPVLAQRSQQTARGERADKRRAHWQSIAIAACEQCGRNRVPPVEAPCTLDDFLRAAAPEGPVAMAGPGAKESLAALASRSPPRHVVVGPEGGFTEAELLRATALGATIVHLGPRVLRAETAAVVALATIAAVAGDAR